jgi:hypothetical protein
MTHHCSACLVNWWPNQTDHGHCPACGAGTSRSQEPASDDTDTLLRIARDEAHKRDLYARFERYYTQRELDKIAA